MKKVKKDEQSYAPWPMGVDLKHKQLEFDK